MKIEPASDIAATARAEAVRVHAEIDTARGELAGLRKQVESARNELVSGQDETLVQANEHLVLAALASQREIETSEKALAGCLELRTLESRRQPLVDDHAAAAQAERRNEQLQEANTQLLLAAVNAQELREAAEHAQRRQTEFLGVLAHELRNPLAPIRNAAAILGRIPSEGPLLSRMQVIIEQQVQNMSRLVGDLLDVSRVSSGKLRLEMVAVDMNALIEEVVQASQPSMDTRLQLFEVQLPARAMAVHGDPVRLVQVLGNLLDNASKYTQKGGRIRLDVAVVAGSIVATVSDNGIGITPDALSTIFEPFMQEQHATLFNGAGLGIGLTVVRELVEGHGGTVTVASEGKGLGSRFTVTLPLARPTS